MNDRQLEELLGKLTPVAPSPSLRQAVAKRLNEAAPAVVGRIRPLSLLAWAGAAAACIALLIALSQWLVSSDSMRPTPPTIASSTPAPTEADLEAALDLPHLTDQELRQLPLSDWACLLAAHSGPGSRDRYMDYRAQESSLGKPLFPTQSQ